MTSISAWSVLESLLQVLASHTVAKLGVIRWASPVVSFGDPTSSEVATIGINPSDREFVDERGLELEGSQRRFHTLQSLGLQSWQERTAHDQHRILQSCIAYFQRNPYFRWFDPLDNMLSPVGVSYYSSRNAACHLDVVPLATNKKWGSLNSQIRSTLLRELSSDLGNMLRLSSTRLVVLNGRSVVTSFQSLIDSDLEMKAQPDWDLPRKSGRATRGYAFRGTTVEVAGVPLGRSLEILGYNHNIQSSYGVSRSMIDRIGGWLVRET